MSKAVMLNFPAYGCMNLLLAIISEFYRICLRRLAVRSILLYFKAEEKVSHIRAADETLHYVNNQ